MANVDNIDSFNIASFNCQGFKFRNYEFIKKIFDKCSVLLIQEHWLFNFEFKVFKEVLPNCSFHALSSMCDDDLVRGRGYGGTGILWKQNTAASITPIATSSPRLCVVKYATNTHQILIMSIYMPVNAYMHNEEFSNILNEIESLYLQYSNHEFIIGGDFNCDFIRGDERSVVLGGWVGDLGLECPALQPQAPRRPTYYTHDGRPSLLDYLFLSSCLFANLTTWDVYDHGDNMSDHSPTFVVELIR